MVAFTSTSLLLTRHFRASAAGGGAGNGLLSSLPKYLSQSSSSPFSCYSSAAAISEHPSGHPSASSPEPQVNNKKERGSSWSKWLLFLPGAITFGLGSWQIFRRQDKINMLEYRQKRLAMEPLKINGTVPSGEQLDSLEFRRVAFQGLFDEKRSVYVGPRSRSISGVTENGYYVITPLVPILSNLDSVQSPILVNRGWVPRSWKDQALGDSHDSEQSSVGTRPSAQESMQSSWWRFLSKKPKVIEDQIPSVTPVEVVGVVRESEKPSIFVPENDPISCQWFYVDVPAIARFCGLPENTIYVEDINENINSGCPYPLPKDVNTLIHSSVMPQDHLNYMLTWYALSGAVTFMAIKRIRPRKIRR